MYVALCTYTCTCQLRAHIRALKLYSHRHARHDKTLVCVASTSAVWFGFSTTQDCRRPKMWSLDAFRAIVQFTPAHHTRHDRLVASGITQTLCAIVPSCVFTQSVARKFVLIVCQRRRCCAVVTQRGSVELSRTDNGGPERTRARTMRVVFIEQNKHERRHVNSEPRAAAAAR